MSYFVIALLRRVVRTEHPTSGKIILEIYIISFQQQWTLVQKIQKILHCTHCPKKIWFSAQRPTLSRLEQMLEYRERYTYSLSGLQVRYQVCKQKLDKYRGIRSSRDRGGFNAGIYIVIGTVYLTENTFSFVFGSVYHTDKQIFICFWVSVTQRTNLHLFSGQCTTQINKSSFVFGTVYHTENKSSFVFGSVYHTENKS